MAEPGAHKCESNPCSAVSEFIGHTQANIKHLTKDFEDIKLNTRECLLDMRRSAEVVKAVELTLTAVQEATKQQNIRLQEGDERFLSHERRMGEIEKHHKKISETMDCLPEKISKSVGDAFDKHHKGTHKPLEKRVKYMLWALAGLFLFLLTTEHGMELLHFIMRLNPLSGKP